MILALVSGIGMLFYLKKTQVSAFWTGGAGLMIVALILLWALCQVQNLLNPKAIVMSPFVRHGGGFSFSPRVG